MHFVWSIGQMHRHGRKQLRAGQVHWAEVKVVLGKRALGVIDSHSISPGKGKMTTLYLVPAYFALEGESVVSRTGKGVGGNGFWFFSISATFELAYFIFFLEYYESVQIHLIFECIQRNVRLIS